MGFGYFSGWWLNQLIWKICSSNWIISPGIGMKIKHIWNHHPVLVASRFILLADHMPYDFPTSRSLHRKKTTDSFHVLELPFDFWKKKTANKKQLHFQPFWIAPRSSSKISRHKNVQCSLTTGFCWGESFFQRIFPITSGPSPWLNPPLHSGPGAEGPNDISGLNFSSRLG